MLTLTRQGRAPDMNRISNAVSRPGIDPRIWAAKAVVLAVVVDPEAGYFADIMIVPDEIPATAAIAPGYAGNGFGFFLPVEVDDMVIVVAPNGDPDAGLVIVARNWDRADPPPADVAEHPTDLLLQAKEGKTIRLVTTGAGHVVIDARGSGEVRLGGEEDLKRAAREGDTIKISGANLTALQTKLDARYSLGGGAPLTAIHGVIDSGSDKVKLK